MKSSKFNTALQFARNLRTTGALYQTSRKLELEICSKVSDAPDLVYVEFGMGHGNITREILDRISPSSRLYSFEINEEFCKHVKNEISDERLTIINDGAENVAKHVPVEIDGIISSIPFTLFSAQKRRAILSQTKKQLKSGQYLSQVLYSTILTKLFLEFFPTTEVIKLSGIPVEHVHHCKK